MKILGTLFKLRTQSQPIYFILERKEKNKYFGFCAHGLPENACNNGFQITSRDLSLYISQGICHAVTSWNNSGSANASAD